MVSRLTHSYPNSNMYRQLVHILIILSLLVGVTPLQAQVPQGITFQGIARDASGLPVSSTTVNITVRILNSGSVLQYEETHTQLTDTYGLFDIIIGQGSPVTNTFASIDWAANNHQVQILLNGTSLATIAFQSVPYALVADEVDMSMSELNDVNIGVLSSGQILQWSGTQWAPAGLPTSVWTQNATDAYYTSGDVGIGNTNPNIRLDVEDTDYQLRLGNTNPGGDDWYIGSSATAWTAGAGKLVFSPTSSTSATSMVITNNSEVGMGTNTPVGRLQVIPFGSLDNGGSLQTTAAGLLVGASTSGIALDADQIEQTGSADLFVNLNGGGNLRLVEGGGNVGVGVIGTTPAALLQINQTSNAAGGSLRLVGNGTPTFWDIFRNTAGDLEFDYLSNPRGSINQTTGVYTNLSDRRAKKNITLLGPILDKVMMLQPSSYLYKSQSDGATPSVGFIAQEVGSVFPELVHDVGEYQGLSYGEFSVLAIKAIQEQQEMIQKQESALQVQKDRLDQQEQEMNQLKSELEAIKALMNQLQDEK